MRKGTGNKKRISLEVFHRWCRWVVAKKSYFMHGNYWMPSNCCKCFISPVLQKWGPETTGCLHKPSWWWIHAATRWSWGDTRDWCPRGQVCLQVVSHVRKPEHFFSEKVERERKKTVLPFAIFSCVQTVVSTSERPHGASVLCYGDGVRAAAGHLSHAADVFHQCGHVATLAVTVSCRKNRKDLWILRSPKS